MTGSLRTQTMWALVVAAALSVVALGAHATPVDDLKAQVDDLAKRIALLEQKPELGAIPTTESASAPISGPNKKGRNDAARLPFGYGFQFLEYPGQ